jgi:Lipopolysaccharide-assembly
MTRFSGVLRPPTLAPILALVLLATGCNYSFRAGTGFEQIKTLVVAPFENETDRLELTQEVYDVLLRELPRALGVTPAGEDVADAVVLGTISSYQVTSPNYRPDPAGGRPEVLQRQVVLAVSVRIVDLEQNLILWESRALRSQGQFLEASETEDVGREIAIDLLIQKIVDGAQSNW